jgi:pimeloyl-ACP methyl ester carboxylesterase
MTHRPRVTALAALVALVASLPATSRAEPIAEARTLYVDGAALYLLVRGDDRAAPLLLWLHGGPGAAERPLFRYYDGSLERHFVVAYWDQRGAGRSYDPGADSRALTVARHLADLDAVVDELRRRFTCERLLLLGHSWGGALALLYAAAHPTKVGAVAAVAPAIATRAAQQAEWRFVAEEAVRRDDDDVRTALAALGPPPYADAERVLALERLADRYGAIFHRPPSRWWVVLRGVLAGLVTPWELPRLVRANEVTLAAMQPELLDLDLRRSVPALTMPVVFLLGRHDHHADARIAADYLAALQAPTKRLVWFERSAHNPPFEEPEGFVAAVVRELGAAHE